MAKPKKKPLQVYLTESRKAFIENETYQREMSSMSDFIISLIDKEQKRVERGNK